MKHNKLLFNTNIEALRTAYEAFAASVASVEQVTFWQTGDGVFIYSIFYTP